MSVHFPELQLRITGHYAEGPPNRRLQLTCVVKNADTYPVCIVSSWLWVDMERIGNLAEGDLFFIDQAFANPAFIAAGAESQGRIIVDLRPDVLGYIERKRPVGELELKIRSRLLVFQMQEHEQFYVPVEPRQTQFNTTFGTASYRIAHSDWVNLLTAIGWSESELLEIPSSLIAIKPTTGRAIGCFEDATKCYRSGMWDETLLNCRKAFEALIKDTLGVNEIKKGQAQDAIKTLVKHDEKGVCIDAIIMELNPFLHFGRHEGHPPVPINKIEAEVALRVTGALLMYIAAA